MFGGFCRDVQLNVSTWMFVVGKDVRLTIEDRNVLGFEVTDCDLKKKWETIPAARVHGTRRSDTLIFFAP